MRPRTTLYCSGCLPVLYILLLTIRYIRARIHIKIVIIIYIHINGHISISIHMRRALIVFSSYKQCLGILRLLQTHMTRLCSEVLSLFDVLILSTHPYNGSIHYITAQLLRVCSAHTISSVQFPRYKQKYILPQRLRQIKVIKAYL